MFSKENRRFSLLTICIAALAIVTLVVMDRLIERGLDSKTLFVTGFVSLIITQLLAMLRQEQSDKVASSHRNVITQKIDKAAQIAEVAKDEATETKQVIKKIEQQTEKVAVEAAEQVKAALHTPIPEQEAMPRTPDQLRKFVTDMCEITGLRAGEVAALKVLEEMRKKTGRH